MSRIGKKAIADFLRGTASVEGQNGQRSRVRKGALQVVLPDDIAAKVEEGGVKVDPRTKTKRALAMWGTSRTLIANLVTGVTKGISNSG